MAHVHRLPHNLALGDLEDSFLAPVEHVINRVAGGVRVADDFARRLNQPPQKHLVLDHVGVVFGVGGRGDAVIDVHDVFPASDLLQFAGIAEGLLQQHAVKRLILLETFLQELEDRAMFLPEEAILIDQFKTQPERLGIHHHGAQRSHFGLKAVRGDLVE